MSRQKGGGSTHQSLRYVDPYAPEQSASAGSNLLLRNGLVVRPAIGGGTRKRKGGFYPSVMSGIVNAGILSAPLATFAARKLFTRKSHGGSKKGNAWKAQREESKAILQAYGKPTAINIQKYALARRRGTEASEEYLEQYRKRKQENQEAKEAKKAARLAQKEAKKMEREAKKASKKGTKKATKPKAKKEKTKKNKPKGKHLYFNNEGREISGTQAREIALNSLAKKVNEAPAGKTRKSPSNKSKRYFEELRKAREYLGTIGAPSGPNMSKYASMKLKGMNTSAWEENFKTRRPLGTATKKAKKQVKIKTPEGEKPRTPTVNRPRTPEPEKPKSPPKTTAVKTRKSPSNKSKRYFEELRKAREYLGTIGAPLGPNMSKYASMKLKGQNTSAWEENFKTRRPLTLATAKKSSKPKTNKPKTKTQKAKKPLTTVVEQNENENEMQGYSENFESEN
jgi:hypothetical protein